MVVDMLLQYEMADVVQEAHRYQEEEYEKQVQTSLRLLKKWANHKAETLSYSIAPKEVYIASFLSSTLRSILLDTAVRLRK